MAKIYRQNINGIDHTFQLSDEDAKNRGLTSKDVVEPNVETATTPLDFDEPTTDGQQTETKQAAVPKNKAVPAADTK